MISCCQDVSGMTCQAFLHDSSRRNLGFQLSFGRDGRPVLLTVPEDSLSQLLQVGGPSPLKERQDKEFRMQ
jgi:hypothetical protein